MATWIGIEHLIGRLTLLICLGLLCTLPASAQWHERTEAIMGTRIHVEFFSTAPDAERLLDRAIAEFHRIDHAFSPYKESSELSHLNRSAPQGWVDVSDEMSDLLAKSRRISTMTGGAFDITYASVGRYYDYREGAAPNDATLLAALQAINYAYVDLDATAGRVRYRHPKVYVDLGGIAKGHAVDRVVDLLVAEGVEHLSVAAGGDSRIVGDRRGKPWTVGIRHPRQPDQMSAILPLVDTSVSTSGDYERYFERDGVRYHHILDPSTGRSAQDAWSVTILGPDTTFTDALSTSVFVLGPERGLALIDSLPGIDAIIVDPTGRLLFSADLLELNAADPSS
ncbi:MAG: FAD:protein FMN transferase [Pseudomonadota bacterium]